LKSNTKIIANIVFMTATLHHCRFTTHLGLQNSKGTPASGDWWTEIP